MVVIGVRGRSGIMLCCCDSGGGSGSESDCDCGGL